MVIGSTTFPVNVGAARFAFAFKRPSICAPPYVVVVGRTTDPVKVGAARFAFAVREEESAFALSKVSI